MFWKMKRFSSVEFVVVFVVVFEEGSVDMSSSSGVVDGLVGWGM